MPAESHSFLHTLVASAVYSAVGIVMFLLGILIIQALAPFSIRKEIEEDQNTALAIVIGSIMIGLGLIIASAVGG